jgi:predicted RNA-binding Zn ribbon-like protein
VYSLLVGEAGAGVLGRQYHETLMPLTELAPDERDDLALALDLANTWETLDPPSERLPDLATLRRVLVHHRREEASAVATETDVPAVRRLRDALRQTFFLGDETAAVAHLNALLDGVPAPQLLAAGDGWRFGWDEAGPAFLSGTTAVALLDAIRRYGFGRFGVCAGAPCTGVYVDRSRNASRRYCCWLCADRVTQAAARARRRKR